MRRFQFLELIPQQVMLSRCSTPEEFFKLFTLGEFHEIHDDFYDPDTGRAYQPFKID